MSPLPLNEAAEIDRVVATLEDQLRADYSPPGVKRDAHPKMHGCVQAEFQVDDNVPDHLRQGIFAHRGKTFLAWVRFSNAFGIQHDIEFEARGMAIKVLDVPGDRLEGDDRVADDEERTQDFLLATHDAFFLPSVDGYAEFAAAAAAGPMKVAGFFFRRGLWCPFVQMWRSALVLARSPLAIPYYSQTPYEFGPGQAMKLQARPCQTRALAASPPAGGSFWIRALAGNAALFLRELHGTKEKAEEFCDRYIADRDLLRRAMMSFLADHEAGFEICVQTRKDSSTTPIDADDDPTVSWSECLWPFRKVATIRIPRQVFWPEPGLRPNVMKATSDMADLGENMSFNPWHALKDHKPLGGINRARRVVYPAIAGFRRDQNKVTRLEPTAAYIRLRPIVQDCHAREARDRPEGQP